VECILYATDILATQTQQYIDDPIRASDVLFGLRDTIPKDQSIWLISIDNALANLFLRQGEWRLALGSLDRILEGIPAAVEYELQQQFPNASDRQRLASILQVAYRCEILSRQGRALLQVGALPEVQQRFLKARTEWENVLASNPLGEELGSHGMVRTIPCLLETNEGLYYFSKSNYEMASDSFTRATEQFRANGSLVPKYRTEDWMGPTVAGSETHHVLYSECINNIALCALYTCRMGDAIRYLEDLVREDPTAFLTERVAFNLATLYELGSDSAASARKKRVLQLIAKRFFLHDVGPENFRVI
jgi:tetratricopeptide (TPR) repeat protein